MSDLHFPRATAAHAQLRRSLAPAQAEAFEALSRAVFADGALDKRMKQLIAVACAHVTQCPWCIDGHVKGARRAGATPEQIMEAIWVAAEMRAGGAYAHSALALDTISHYASERAGHPADAAGVPAPTADRSPGA